MSVLYSGPDNEPATLLLAHGAGSGMESPWLVDSSRRLADRGVRTARFEFGYMASRRVGVRRASRGPKPSRMSMGHTDPANGTTAYGRPSDELIADAMGCP